MINQNGDKIRFKVYFDYKLKLKAYSKKRFDPFCRWDRIIIPYNNTSSIQTTIGQLNFFKWALENRVIDYIDNNYHTSSFSEDSNRIKFLVNNNILNPHSYHPTKLGHQTIANLIHKEINTL